MPTTYLPAEDHIARYVRSGLLIRDETRLIIGVHPSAFVLREAERNLSVDWMERYPGSKAAQLREVARHAELRLKNNDAYGSSLRLGYFPVPVQGGTSKCGSFMSQRQIIRLIQQCINIPATIWNSQRY